MQAAQELCVARRDDVDDREGEAEQRGEEEQDRHQRLRPRVGRDRALTRVDL
jgi:hypothetical protein